MGAVAAAVIAAGLLALRNRPISSSPSPELVLAESVPATGPSAPPASREPAVPSVAEALPLESEPPKVTHPPTASGLLGEPTAEPRAAIEGLTRVELRNGAVPLEQAAAWKQNLRQLVQLGASAIPAIQEFLRKNRDIDFGLAGWNSVGYPSLRTGLFDALREIGGPAAMEVSLEALQSAVVPREVAVLAKSIEFQEPGIHRSAILV